MGPRRPNNRRPGGPEQRPAPEAPVVNSGNASLDGRFLQYPERLSLAVNAGPAFRNGDVRDRSLPSAGLLCRLCLFGVLERAVDFVSMVWTSFFAIFVANRMAVNRA